MEINKSICIKTILIWEGQFNQYKCYESIILENIDKINDVRDELEHSLKYENNDDYIFYIASIENSLFFLIKKLQISKAKLLEDFNNIWLKIDCTKNFLIVDKHNFFLLLRQYKLMIDIILSKHNKIKYTWLKSSQIENLLELEKHITKLLVFHLAIIKYLAIISELNKDYYTSKIDI